MCYFFGAVGKGLDVREVGAEIGSNSYYNCFERDK